MEVGESGKRDEEGAATLGAVKEIAGSKGDAEVPEVVNGAGAVGTGRVVGGAN